MKSYPVNLMLKNKQCLVVGGGKIAFRKIENLTKTDARVNVVSPKFINDIVKLSENYKLHLIKKIYDKNDLENIFLVFAATNDRNVNLKVLNDAVERKILCCSIDENWTYGNFITPASFIHNNTVISISTNGTHCRKAKFIKNILSDNIKEIQAPELVVIGVACNTISFVSLESVQKRAFYDKLTIKDYLGKLNGIYEFKILRTCNRLEVLTIMDSDKRLVEIIKRLPGFDLVSDDSIYVHKGFKAFEYLCTLAAGLNSGIIGEHHITSQFKKALIETCENKRSKVLLSFSNLILQVSKLIRNNILNKLHLLDIEGLFLEVVKKEFPDLTKIKVVIAGAGEMGRGLALAFSKENIQVTCLYHKVKPKNLSLHKNITVGKLAELQNSLIDADIFISSLSLDKAYFYLNDFVFFGNCKIIFDVGVPRNISSDLEKKFTSQKYIHFTALKEKQREKNINRRELIAEAQRLILNFHEKYNEISEGYENWN